jgi:hypothetical protein
MAAAGGGRGRPLSQMPLPGLHGWTGPGWQLSQTANSRGNLLRGPSNALLKRRACLRLKQLPFADGAQEREDRRKP